MFLITVIFTLFNIFLNKKRWKNKKNVKSALFFIEI